MKALSVQNPWAWAIIAGLKDVENRSWRTAYRGKIYIHTSGPIVKNGTTADPLADYDALWWLLEEIEKKPEDYGRHASELRYLGVDSFTKKTVENLAKIPLKQYPGYIIGTVDLVDCVRGYTSDWSVRGQYQFVLKNPEIIDPVKAKGKLGLFDLKL